MGSDLTWIEDNINELKESGLYNNIRTIDSAMDAKVIIDGREMLNFCANNYLGLANHPRIREAAKKGRGPLIDEARLDNALRDRPGVDELVACVAKAYGVSEQVITRRMKAPSAANFPRKVAMHLCQHVGDHSLHVIAKAFHVSHIGSVSRAIHDVKTFLHETPDQRVTRLYKFFNIKQ